MKVKEIRQSREKTEHPRAATKPIGTRNRCNPCAVCQRNSLECPWILEETPVPGWDAEPTRIEDNKMPENRDSWHIRRCPLYIPPSARKARQRQNR